MDGNADDLGRECQRYEEKIKACGGIELFLGGTFPWIRLGPHATPGQQILAHHAFTYAGYGICFRPNILY